MIKPLPLPRGTLPTERGELDSFGNPISPRKPKTLINFRSNLRSFKYGSGQGEPFIWTPLPSYGDPATSVYLGEDSLGRTGIRTAVETDTKRLGLFLASGRGQAFIAKQKALTNTRVQAPYAPVRSFNAENLLLQSSLQGTGVHINSLGLNPFTSPIESYEFLTRNVYTGNKNRLVLLYDSKIGEQPLTGGQVGVATLFGISPLGKDTLFSYPGGPGGLFTLIRKNSKTSKYKPNTKGYYNVYTLTSKQLAAKAFSGNNGALPNTIITSNFIREVYKEVQTDKNAPRILGRITDYEQFRRDKQFNTGDPGRYIATFDRQKYYRDSPSKTVGTDTLNLKKIYSSDDGKVNFDKSSQDLIKFYLAVIDNNNPQKKTYVHFRAYLSGLSDSFGANWNTVNYPGRGEEFYTYGGFTRDISLSFKVHVGSRIELFPVYNKLNYLASIMAPDYSEAGFMRGNIVQLTIGDYINNMYGVITGFNYSIPDDSPWEVARTDEGISDPNTGELPMLIDVNSFAFKPIHNFIPQTVRNLDQPEAKFLSLGDKGYGKDKRGEE